MITDLGSWTDELTMSQDASTFQSENYDNNRLWNGPYPMRLKDRIVGRGGHLQMTKPGNFFHML